jgi:hypothetical protein
MNYMLISSSVSKRCRLDDVVFWLIMDEVKWRCDWVMRTVVKGWDDFFIAVECESSTVQGGWSTGGVDSIFRFRLEKWGDRTKRCRKLKRSQWACLESMRKKYDTARRRKWGERRYREGEREETMSVGLTRILLGQKINKIRTVDSVDTNGWWRFKETMS